MNAAETRAIPKAGPESSDKAKTQGGKTGRTRTIFSRYPEICIFAVYFLATVFLTWPLIAHFTTSIYGYPSDNLGGIWVFWWLRNAHALGGSASFSPLIGFPFGTTLSAVPTEPVGYLISRLFLLFMPEVIYFNLDIFLSFLLSGITMYYLVRYLTRDRRAAFFAGLAYLVLPYHAYHASIMGGGISAIEWMPLYILLLIKFLKKADLKNAILLGIGALVVAGTSNHYALFMGIFTAAFLIGRYAHSLTMMRREAKLRGERVNIVVNRRTLVSSLTILLVVVLAVLPIFVVSVSNRSPPGRWTTMTIPEDLRIEEYFYLNAARPLNYVVPDSASPLFAALGIGRKISYDTSLFLGWTVLALALLGFYFVLRKPGGRKYKGPGEDVTDERSRVDPTRGITEEGRHTFWGFALAAAVAFVLSLPPYVTVGSVRIPLPSTLFEKFTPWYRWDLRLGVVVAICFIVIAGFGLSQLLKKVRGYSKEMLLIAVTLLMVAELLIVPPFINFDFAKDPGVVTAVKNLPEGSAFMFYPAVESGDFKTSELEFYQTHFVKPMLNGAISNSDGEALRRTVFNPFSKATPGILSRFGLNYIVFLKNEFVNVGKVNLLDRIAPGLKLMGVYKGKGHFGNAYLFKNVAPRADLVPLYLGDITVPSSSPSIGTIRLLVEKGTIRILNYSGRPVIASFELPIWNPGSPHTVIVQLGRKKLWGANLGKRQSAVARTDGITIPPRGLDLTIKASGPLDGLLLPDLLTFGTGASSVILGEVTITPRAP